MKMKDTAKYELHLSTGELTMDLLAYPKPSI